MLAAGFGDIPAKALAIHNLATSEYRLGRYEDADSHYRESIRIWESQGRSADLAFALSNFAELRQARGNNPDALALSTRAIELGEQTGRLSGSMLTIHGNILRTAGRVAESRVETRSAVAPPMNPVSGAEPMTGRMRTAADDVPRAAVGACTESRRSVWASASRTAKTSMATDSR